LLGLYETMDVEVPDATAIRDAWERSGCGATDKESMFTGSWMLG
jgi:hypothetical protein